MIILVSHSQYVQTSLLLYTAIMLSFCSHDNKLIGELHVVISLEDHGCVQSSCDPTIRSCDPTIKSCDPTVRSCDRAIKPSVTQGQ